MICETLFRPTDYVTLSQKELKDALEVVNLIKEKRDGQIKGITCVDSSKQRKKLKEGETVYSPMFSVEALMSTLVIDALERRDAVILDVPRTFLDTATPEGKNMMLVIRCPLFDMI